METELETTSCMVLCMLMAVVSAMVYYKKHQRGDLVYEIFYLFKSSLKLKIFDVENRALY